MGVEKGFKYIAFDVQADFIAKVEDGLYSVIFEINGLKEKNENFLISADFTEDKLKKLLLIIPKKISEVISFKLTRQPYEAVFKSKVIKFGIVATLNNEVQSNAEESYVPFVVNEFMKWLDMSDSNITTDTKFLNKVTMLYSKYS